jgi:hypothetical protein
MRMPTNMRSALVAACLLSALCLGLLVAPSLSRASTPSSVIPAASTPSPIGPDLATILGSLAPNEQTAVVVTLR